MKTKLTDIKRKRERDGLVVIPFPEAMSGQKPHADYRSLERLGIMDEDFDENHRLPETPPYQRNMSQLTLPPEYLSDSGPQDDDIPPIPRPSTSEEKRRETGDDDTRPSSPELRLQTSNSIVPLGRQSAGVTPVSAGIRSQLPSRSEKDPAGLFDGETLVQPRKDSGKPGQATGYVDEHGEVLRDKSAHPDFNPRDPGGVPHTRRSSIDSTGVPPSVADTDGDSEPDELYDWSDEEDLVDQEAHFEAKLQPSSAKKRGWGVRRCVPLNAKKVPIILTPLSLVLLSGFCRRLSVRRSSHVRSSGSLLRSDISIIFHTRLIIAVTSLETCRRGFTGLPQTYCRLSILYHFVCNSILPRILQNLLVSRGDCECITLCRDMVHLHILGNRHGGVQNENWSLRIIQRLDQTNLVRCKVYKTQPIFSTLLIVSTILVHGCPG